MILHKFIITLVLLISSSSYPSQGLGHITNLDPNHVSSYMGLFGPSKDSNNSNNQSCTIPIPPLVLPIYIIDVLLLQFAQNIEYLEAEFFLWGALGYGLDNVAPELAQDGPPPIGVAKANLDNFTESIVREFGFEEIGHLRALKSSIGGIARPLMDLSRENFAKVVNEAFEHRLEPPFDPYRDSLSYMLASYIIPYVGYTGYVGASPLVQGYVSKRLLSGLLSVEAGQDTIIRMYLYERAKEIVHPYNFTVEEFTEQISILRNRLGMCGIKDENMLVPPYLGAEGNSSANILAANRDSLSYGRTPTEVLRVVYGNGNEHIPGGFFPKGANGNIARIYLNESNY